MTTFSTYMAAALLGVTFGWIPSEETTPSEAASAERGYDYLVKVSAEDLEALRDGRAEEIVSELPADLGRVERIRVYVGEGDAPKRLTPRHESSPQRIAKSGSNPERYEAAKPVVPEWKEAARFFKEQGSNEQGAESDTAQSHTAFQNPNALQEGFAAGAGPLGKTGSWIDGQAQNLAEGTRRFFDESGENLRNGTRSVLDKTGETLEKIVDPYGGRPNQIDANGYPLPSRVTPPESTDLQSSAPQPAGYQDGGAAPTYADPYARSVGPTAAQANPAPTYENRSYDPRYGAAAAGPRGGSVDTNGVVESFTGGGGSVDYNANSRPMTPVQRNTPRTVADPQGEAGGRGAASGPLFDTSNDAWDAFENARPTTLRKTSDEESGFPALRPGQSNDSPAWAGAGGGNDGFAPVGGGFASNNNSQGPPANPTNAAGPPSTDWGGVPSLNQANALAGQGADQSEQANSGASSDFADRLLLIFFGGGFCFMLITHIELRNKYRSLLRGGPGGTYSHSIAA